MAYYISPSPKLHFDDLNGNPLTGGFLKTYLAGSSTPIQTSQDYGGDSLNPTTITLDERGEAKVRLSPILKYKFELYDSNNSFIYSVDNIGVDGAVTTSSITCSDGSVKITPTEDGVDLSISEEVTARENADTSLSNRISELESVTYISPIKKENNQVLLENSTVVPNSYGDTNGSRTLAFGETFKVPNYTVDKYGRLTYSSDIVLTLPSFDGTETNYLLGYSDAFQLITTSYSHLIGTTTSSNGYSFSDGIIHIPNTVRLSNISLGIDIEKDLSSVNLAYLDLKLFNIDANTSVSIGKVYYDYSDKYISISFLVVGGGNFYIQASTSESTRYVGLSKIYINDETNRIGNGGSSSGLTEVIHDSTITGSGTSESPLSIQASLDTKQSVLTAGTNIAITNNVISNTYSLPTASTTILGGVRVDGVTVTIDSNGVISSSGTDSFKVKTDSSDTNPDFLSVKITTTAPIQKRIVDGCLNIYQDPVESSPIQMISSPATDNVLSYLNVAAQGTQQLQWIAIQAHAFTLSNYFTPRSSDIWSYININTQQSSAESTHFVGIYQYDLASNTLTLVAMSNNGASHDASAIGLASLTTGYVNTNSGYNILNPSKIYYAFHACDQTALQVAGNKSDVFNLSLPYPSLVIYNLANGLTVDNFVANYGTINLSSSTISHQESNGKRFVAVRHAS